MFTETKERKTRLTDEELAKYPLADDDIWGDCHDRMWLMSTKETDEKIVNTYYWVRKWASTGKEFFGVKKEVSQKFLCVNGPLLDKRLTEEDGKKNGYRLYNCANAVRISKGFPRSVLVYFSI